MSTGDAHSHERGARRAVNQGRKRLRLALAQTVQDIVRAGLCVGCGMCEGLAAP